MSHLAMRGDARYCSPELEAARTSETAYNACFYTLRRSMVKGSLSPRRHKFGGHADRYALPTGVIACISSTT